ncbi:MAG: pyrroloquinoline quinone biosynthesis peptide chaperone PqqD [Pseudomonadota bacterium]|jgi:pyrroloquinoline quinone biosynthesis protein D
MSLTPTAPMAHSAPVPPSVKLVDVPAVRSPYRLQFEPAQDAWVLLYPEGMIKLNRSAGEIMQRCDGRRHVAHIVADLEAAFGVPGLQTDVLAFLNLARLQGWLRVQMAEAA